MCALKTSNSLEAWGGIPALPLACLMHHQMTRTTLMMKQHELGVSWPWFKIVNQKLTERAPEPWDCLSKDSVYLLWMSFVREQRDIVPGTRAVHEKETYWEVRDSSISPLSSCSAQTWLAAPRLRPDKAREAERCSKNQHCQCLQILTGFLRVQLWNWETFLQIRTHSIDASCPRRMLSGCPHAPNSAAWQMPRWK